MVTKTYYVTMTVEAEEDREIINTFIDAANKGLDATSGLFIYPKVESISNIQLLDGNAMTRERAIQIASEYIAKDVETADTDYIRYTLEELGVSDREKEELGLAWLNVEEVK